MNDSMKIAMEKAGIEMGVRVSIANDEAMMLLQRLRQAGYHPVFNSERGARIDFVNKDGVYSTCQLVLNPRGTWSIQTSITP